MTFLFYGALIGGRTVDAGGGTQSPLVEKQAALAADVKEALAEGTQSPLWEKWAGNACGACNSDAVEAAAIVWFPKRGP